MLSTISAYSVGAPHRAQNKSIEISKFEESFLAKQYSAIQTNDLFFKARPKKYQTNEQKKAGIRKAQIKFRLSQEAYIKQLEAAYQEKFHKNPQSLKPLPSEQWFYPDNDKTQNLTPKERNRKAQANFKIRRRIYVQRLEAELSKNDPIANQKTSDDNEPVPKQRQQPAILEPNAPDEKTRPYPQPPDDFLFPDSPSIPLFNPMESIDHTLEPFLEYIQFPQEEDVIYPPQTHLREESSSYTEYHAIHNTEQASSSNTLCSLQPFPDHFMSEIQGFTAQSPATLQHPLSDFWPIPPQNSKPAVIQTQNPNPFHQLKNKIKAKL